jgi:uncharacterized protein YndB with AHSA1/START domain
MNTTPRTIRKEVVLPHPPEDVWLALTDPQALAEWLMPNNFEPVVGRKFRFHVDPMPGPYPGGSECEVLEVDAPRRLVYTWACLRKDQTKPHPPPTTVTWTLTPEPGGTRLVLEHSGFEYESFWLRVSMNMGWGRMIKKLLPRVLHNVNEALFIPGAIVKRDYGTKTVPPGYAK